MVEIMEIEEEEEAHHTPSESVFPGETSLTSHTKDLQKCSPSSPKFQLKKREWVQKTEIDDAHHTPNPAILHNWRTKDRNGSTSVQASISSHWEPRNLLQPDKVFLSHSGVDKPFAKTVYKKLLKSSYVAFLDQVSLPKATTVTMRNILQVARECRIAVFFLSNAFFLNTKNPMLELAAAIDSERLLLPLFYGLTVKEFKDKKRHQEWLEKWKEWEDEESGKECALEDDLKVNMSKWQSALEIIGRTNGVELERGRQSKKAYRKAVIQCIMKRVPPYLPRDDSKVQGKKRLCQIVEGLFGSKFSNQTEPRILGLFGMGGVGKTTLCSTALLNFYSYEFNMKVCCIELESGQSSQSKEEELKRIKKLLKALTDAPQELVERADVQQGWPLLRKYIQGNKVFLAVDNVSPETEKECLRYLEGGFQSGSKIVITGRSEELLESVLKKHHGQSHLTNVPSLMKEEATQIFVQELGHGDKQLTQEESSIIQDCLEVCRFDQSNGYHALALVVLAALLGDTSPQDWKRTVTAWQSKRSKAIIDSKAINGYNRSVFEVLVISYNALTEKEKRIFIDIVLFVPRKDRYSGKLLEWLEVLHEAGDVESSLKVLRKRALLNCRNEFHDLHQEMAVRVVNEAANSRSLFLEAHRRKLNQELFEEMMVRCAGIDRIGFANCEFEEECLDFGACGKLQVLKLKDNKGLREVEIGRNRFLRSLEVESREADEDSRVVVGGWEKCCLLEWLSFESCVPKDPTCLEKQISFSHLTNLRDVRLVRCGGLEVLGLGSQPWTLERLSIQHCHGLVTVDGLSSLKWLGINNCSSLQKICAAGAVEYGRAAIIRPPLEYLSVFECSNLVEIQGVDRMESLSELWIGKHELTDLLCANISDCTHLKRLTLSILEPYTSLDLRRMTKLQYAHFHRSASASVIQSLAELPNLANCYLNSLPSQFSRVELVQLLTPQLSQPLAMGVIDYISKEVLPRLNKGLPWSRNEVLLGRYDHVVPLCISLLTKYERPRYTVLRLLHTLQMYDSLSFRRFFLGTVGMIDALLHFDPEHPASMRCGLALIQYANKNLRVPIEDHIAKITNALALVFSNPLPISSEYDDLKRCIGSRYIADVNRRTCMLAREEHVVAKMEETNIYHWVEPKLVKMEEEWL